MYINLFFASSEHKGGRARASGEKNGHGSASSFAKLLQLFSATLHYRILLVYFLSGRKETTTCYNSSKDSTKNSFTWKAK
jgi:hypothetical protein